jgi:hypothetical protein
MVAVGVRGAQWRGEVTPWGDVLVDGEIRLRWFIAADDRWYEPARETTVRQRQVSGVPVIETRLKVPGGDAVQRVYGVANFGGVIVVEIYNDSSLPFAVAFDRGDISTMRAPSPTGVQGIDLPSGSVVFPVGHHATMRAAIRIGAANKNSGQLTASELEGLPSYEQVERGWLAALQTSSRVDLPELTWSTMLTQKRCEILLSEPQVSDRQTDEVEFILDIAERVRLGDKAAQWASDVAVAAEKIIKRCARNKIVQWDEDRAILAAGMVLDRAGESRGRDDVARVWSRLAEPGVSRELNALTKSSSRGPAWIESQLIAHRRDGMIDICPRGIDESWLGVNFECHKLLATPLHTISYAVRWHGERPALLWDIDGPTGLRVVASAIDKTFSSTDIRGEALLSGFANVGAK